MDIVALDQLPVYRTNAFFREQWGSNEMIISTGTYRCSELEGFACVDHFGGIIGLVTLFQKGATCEIVSLDSVRENGGIGSRLLLTAENHAYRNGCLKIELITTNDNIKALDFYQKRGYRMVSIIRDAVAEARLRKPEIPLIAGNGIAILDEILLEKQIRENNA
ncbi:GNAT family N-acetyltransferase [Bacillus sp. 1P06AnD]|uniref:GNAT family N-acetyltransferase n=1 Tax=Bacillus sp. 1P06AnD TaxID=3132208 RepID=UPI0039A22ED4